MNINDSIPLSEHQKQTLTGMMLGDGHLAKTSEKSNAYLTIGRSVRDIDFLKYEMQIFNNMLQKRFDSLNPDITNKSTGSIISFCTKRNPSLNEFYYKWYNEKTKIIPKDLILTPITIAHWFCDDGSIYTNKLPYRFVIEFSTHGFSKKEVEFLASLLNKKYKEDFLIKKKNRKEKKYFVIMSYDSASRKLIKDIDNFVPIEMSRKRIWENSRSRFYSDQPERQIEKIKNFELRKILFQNFLKSIEKPFTIKNLCEFLKVDNVNTYSYLKFYLENNLIEKVKIKNTNFFYITNKGKDFIKDKE